MRKETDNRFQIEKNSGGEPLSGKGKAALWGIFALALLLRLLHVFSIADLPLIHDEVWYDGWAAKINSGVGFSTLYCGPGYPYFLGLVYFLYGHNPLIAQIVQAILSAGMCFVIFELAKRLFTKKTAYLASLLCALSTLLVYYSGLLMTETLFIFLLALFALFLVKALQNPTVKNAMYAGLLFGVTSLTRSETLLYFALAVPAIFAYHRFDWRKSAKQCAIILAFSLLVILPWTARNFVLTQQFVLISSQSGITFWQGNNPQATGGHFDLPQEMIARYGLTIELDKFAFHEAMKFIKENPTQWLQLCGNKVSLYFTRWTDGNHWSVDNQSGWHHRSLFIQRFTPPLVSGHWIVFLAIAGALVNFRKTRFLLLFYSFFAANFLFQVIFKFDWRYQLAIAPFLIILAASAFEIHFLLRKIPFKKLLASLAYPLKKLASIGAFLLNQTRLFLGKILSLLRKIPYRKLFEIFILFTALLKRLALAGHYLLSWFSSFWNKVPYKKLLIVCGSIVLFSQGSQAAFLEWKHQKSIEDVVIIEGENAFQQNFGQARKVIMKKPQLLGRASLELQRNLKPENGYHSDYRFRVKKEALYHLYIAGTPPGPVRHGSEWFSPYWIQVDDDRPYHLTEERLRKNWPKYPQLGYIKGQYFFSKILSLRLSAGEHTLTVWVDEPRKHDGQYVFFLDAFILAPEDFIPEKNVGRIPKRLFLPLT